MIQGNGKISHAVGLEKLILLKWPYYTNKLQIYCNPYQNTHDIFHRTGTTNTKIYMEQQKNQSTKATSR